MKVSNFHEDWREVIYCGMENQQIDFKAAQDWGLLTRPGRAKFARHAMALANTLGGYVVIGVGEDSNGNPIDYQGMTPKQAASFDPSTVGQTINRYADPAVEFDIVRPEIDGKVYVVMVVYPFRNMPHVCGDVCDDELQRGVFYIRTPEARSRAAYRASELHPLIQRALRNQRQMLGRMLRGILYENRQSSDEQDVRAFDGLLAKSRLTARNILGVEQTRSLPMMELIVHPPKFLPETSLSNMRQTLLLLDRPSVKDFPSPGAHRQGKLTATNESLRGWQSDATGKQENFWELFQSGLLYCAVPLTVEDQSIQAEELLKLVLTATVFTGQVFAALNCLDEVLNIRIRINNTNNIMLKGMTSSNGTEAQPCLIPDVEVVKYRSAGDLEAGAAADIAEKIFREICKRFNVSLERTDSDLLKEQLDEAVKHALLGV